ncbi:MAG: lytic murein transglycosylase B [Gammaproteobacteria bacterium]|nr:lytic murein transglycosylase B [Gammaproteobacteria bacterium]
MPGSPPSKIALQGYAARPEVQLFVTRLVQQDGFKQQWLDDILGSAHSNALVISAITKPYESKPWYQYKPLFVNDRRIDAGVDFWNSHAQMLARAQQEYGVPADLIVAILGVESFYGREKGAYSVLDALTTLAFDYPPRAQFFQHELEQYLLLCREQSFDPRSLTGSYAGAMGVPQFMPDSYRQYAVASVSGGHPDIWNNWGDIIDSVANYFKIHGWRENGLVALPAALLPKHAVPPTLTITQVGVLRRQGVILSAGPAADTPSMLIPLQLKTGTQYWVGFDNFRVITQYNKSPLYAMAVFDLSARISEKRALDGQYAPP